MSTITVTGAATAAVSPDRAVLHLALTHLAPTASAAMAEVSNRVTTLAALLGESGVARTDWATSGVMVGEESEWRNDRSVVLGQRATTTVSVTVRALDTLGELLRRAVDDAGARVDHMGWVVDDQNPARLQLLADAARDARVRADAYAAALGLAVSGVDAVSETPFGSGGSGAEAWGGPMLRSKAMMADAAMPVNAGDVDLTASVHVRFTVVPS